MVIADLHHEPRFERLPFARSLRGPAAWPSRRRTGESGRRNQGFEPPSERRLVLLPDRRREPDVIEQSIFVVKAEQQRADQRLAFVVAEAAYHAVGGAV